VEERSEQNLVAEWLLWILVATENRRTKGEKVDAKKQPALSQRWEEFHRKIFKTLSTQQKREGCPGTLFTGEGRKDLNNTRRLKVRFLDTDCHLEGKGRFALGRGSLIRQRKSWKLGGLSFRRGGWGRCTSGGERRVGGREARRNTLIRRRELLYDLEKEKQMIKG